MQGVRYAVAALTLALLAPVAPAMATSAPDAPRREPATDTVDIPDRGRVVLTGHGYGHGHGMSQHGAQGAALAGLTHREILGFYYPGTTFGSTGGKIRVLVSADTTDALVVRPRSGLTVRAVGGAKLALPARRNVTAWRITAASRGRSAVAFRRPGRGWTVWKRLPGGAEFAAAGRPVTLVLPGGATARYRGRLRSAPVPGTARSRDTVNVVGLEKYLRGVVPREMPASWHPQAVQSQAVAARTYAAFERAAAPAGRHWQVCDTTACQVYGGVGAEHPAATAALRATAGLAVFADGAPAFTQFCASSGGWTSAGSRPYLAAQQDPYDDWTGNSVHDWTVRFDDTALERRWPVLGNLTRVRVLDRDGAGEWGGRVRRIRLVGTTGQVTLTGDEFRFALGLRSTYLQVTARAR